MFLQNDIFFHLNLKKKTLSTTKTNFSLNKKSPENNQFTGAKRNSDQRIVKKIILTIITLTKHVGFEKKAKNSSTSNTLEKIIFSKLIE